VNRPAHLQDHFYDMAQQREASTLGMWLFLVTEILFFGGLFTGYAVYRTMYPEAYRLASAELNPLLGAANTVVLLASSLTMALAVRASRLGQRTALVVFLLATMGLGLVFLGVKGYEYAEKFRHHLVPGPAFEFPSYAGPGAQLFYSFYFVMTGLHALHMAAGLGLLAVIAVLSARGAYGPDYNTPVDLSGLYWHFVDLVWIFLFPLLYLIERH
jgi:cytochrome c oxidase subunit 3